jgi:signal transduction histidine kinase
VEDNGIGIDPGLVPILFEPFRAGGSAAGARTVGVGLGLYTVRRLLEMLGGNVSVESEPEVGSTFRVRLPLKLVLSDLSGSGRE